MLPLSGVSIRCKQCGSHVGGNLAWRFCPFCGHPATIGSGLDITGSDVVEISIREDGKVIWINTELGCLLRICQIKRLDVKDGRQHFYGEGSKESSRVD